MKLTRLYPKGKRVMAEFDEGESLLLAQDVALKFQLFPGLELSEQLLQDVRNEQEYFNAMMIADRFIAYRSRSEREVRMKLRQQKISQAAADRAIERMRAAELLDDADFGMKYVHDALLKKPVGRVRLQQELRRKGLDSSAIDAALNLQFTIDEESAAALRLLERRTTRTKTMTPFERAQDLKKYLLSRGFTREAIERALQGNPATADS